jgi:hypothetical protein
MALNSIIPKCLMFYLPQTHTLSNDRWMDGGLFSHGSNSHGQADFLISNLQEVTL